jgi:hypothetical protein
LTPVHVEAQLERALYRQWAPDCEPAIGCWHRLVAFQVNMPNQRSDKNWGEIDLLGTTETGWPIVIELKQGRNDETPAALLVQAAGYGLALQKAWPMFRAEWQSHLAEHLGLRSVLPTALNPCQLVCAAPVEYWNQWIGETPRARTVPTGAWGALGRLRMAFQERGLPATFARVAGEAPLFSINVVTLPQS